MLHNKSTEKSNRTLKQKPHYKIKRRNNMLDLPSKRMICAGDTGIIYEEAITHKLKMEIYSAAADPHIAVQLDETPSHETVVLWFKSQVCFHTIFISQGFFCLHTARKRQTNNVYCYHLKLKVINNKEKRKKNHEARYR